MSDNKTGFIARFKNLTTSMANGTSLVSMAGYVALMILMALDSIMRYVFSAPIEGSEEVVELTLVVAVFTGMAYTQVKKGHIGVDIVYSFLKPGVRRVIDSISSLLIAILLFLVIWQSVLRAGRVTEETTVAFFIPITPFYLVLAMACTVWLLVVLADFLQSTSEVMASKQRNLQVGLIAGGLLTLLVSAVLTVPLLPLRIDPMTAGILGLVVILPVLLTNIPVGFALAGLGLIGLGLLQGIGFAIVPFGQVPFTEGSEYNMSIIPLFVLMGELVYVFGLGQDLYAAAHRWLARLPGGLASATVGACAGFASICGSTVATAVTMATVALPEMKRYKYEPGLATGCCAAGGIIGTMIPPSIAFVIYGILTQQSIGRLFIAGIVPGVLMTVFFIATITLRCWRNPQMGPPGPRSSAREKLASLKLVWSTLVLFLFVMGGIYTGIFTAIEAGGMGAIGALVIGAVMRRFTMAGFIKALRSTITVSGMVFLLFIGATIFAKFVALSRLPFVMADYITGSGLPQLLVIILIIFIFLVLGMVMPSYPVMILIVPIVFPAVEAMGYDPIWFGVMMVLMTEIGALTPPVAIDVFAVAGVAKDVPMNTIYRGVTPFIFALIIVAALLVAFPQIAIFLPTLMKG